MRMKRDDLKTSVDTVLTREINQLRAQESRLALRVRSIEAIRELLPHYDTPGNLANFLLEYAEVLRNG